VSGKILDPRADLFSLGVLGYEIVAGRKPFQGDEAISTAYAIVHTEPPPPSTVNPELPKEFDDIWRRVLAKDPTDRFASASDFHNALVACLAGQRRERSHLALPKARRRHRTRIAIGVAAVAASALVVSFLARKAPEPAAPATPVVPTSSPAPVVPGAAPAPAPAPRPRVVRTAPQAPAAKASVTISLTHRVRRATLVVLLDGAPILTEVVARKSAFPTTVTWQTVQTPAGAHKVTASLRADDGQTWVAAPYSVDLGAGEAVTLRFQLKNDLLMLKDQRG